MKGIIGPRPAFGDQIQAAVFFGLGKLSAGHVVGAVGNPRRHRVEKIDEHLRIRGNIPGKDTLEGVAEKNMNNHEEIIPEEPRPRQEAPASGPRQFDDIEHVLRPGEGDIEQFRVIP